jgi:hypothetical protein
MKKIVYILIAVALCVGLGGCRDFEELNTDPNNPVEVSTPMLLSGVEKFIMDNVYDVYYGGRLALMFSQYWAENNYSDNSRYFLNESYISASFDALYQGVANLEQIIKLNTDEETAGKMVGYGPNNNQIAVARILRAWLYLVITDTWGSVPYSEAGKLKENVYYPKYDSQQDIYNDLLKELKEASAQLDVASPAISNGDRIYNGDAAKWKKFANSLRCRVAIHLSKVDPAWKTHIAEAIASGVFESNADNAVYAYSSTSPNECGFYRGYLTRNDFSISRPFVDLLKGQRDTLNNKAHPWEGTADPRLDIYTSRRDNKVIGLPYGVADAGRDVSSMVDPAPDWRENPPLCLHADYQALLMTYAELKFILSEYNNYDDTHFKEGIRASLAYWGEQNGTPILIPDVDSYLTAVGAATPEKVAIQKYIDLYTNGTEGWTEYRRTGYPEQLLKPNEISCVLDNRDVLFTPISEAKGDIAARAKYPTNESVLNSETFKDAVSKLTDQTNNYYSKMFWDTRTSTNLHPSNK